MCLSFFLYILKINLIEGSEFANPHVFHQLLSEAHMILRTDLTSNTPEDRRENIKASIKRSAVNLGDFFARYMICFLLVTGEKFYLGLIIVEQLCSNICLDHMIQLLFVNLNLARINYHRDFGQYG